MDLLWKWIRNSVEKNDFYLMNFGKLTNSKNRHFCVWRLAKFLMHSLNRYRFIIVHKRSQLSGWLSVDGVQTRILSTWLVFGEQGNRWWAPDDKLSDFVSRQIFFMRI